ncbi:hypothetical protein PU560_05305 [Georgenia sp. 10Sc9-8]|uniref:DUF4129 domain-containing protein n=1 Tax=Georgenia halotolerans TaxID=3028317 RepID=A0ABT5TYD1_9MICO|nr:hypothetical protein [Georgenia halotolerans]
MTPAVPGRRASRPRQRAPRSWAQVTVSAVVGVLAGALVHVLGAAPAHVALTAVAVLVVGTLLGGLGHDAQLPRLPPPERSGSRREVSELAWMLTSRSGRVGPGFHRRLREAARARLALHGLDLADPAQDADVRARLGDAAADTLAAGDRLPTEPQVARCLEALERLGTTRTGGTV